MTDNLKIFLRQANNAFWERFDMLIQRYINKLAFMVIRNADLLQSIPACMKSSEYEKAHLKDVPDFKIREKFFRYALSKASVPGMHLEFGVYKGDSINLLAKICPTTQFVGFDSFEGLPEAWGVGSQKGSFSIKGLLPPVRKNVRLVKGYYDQSLPSFLEKNNEAVSFLHLDSDIYSSTKFVLNQLRDRIRPGTIIVFDDYLNYWGWEDNDFKAFMEYIDSLDDLSFEYIAQMRYTGRVAVKMIEK